MKIFNFPEGDLYAGDHEVFSQITTEEVEDIWDGKIHDFFSEKPKYKEYIPCSIR